MESFCTNKTHVSFENVSDGSEAKQEFSDIR